MNDNAAAVYSDIISLPHHVSPDRPHMAMNERAAQFAGFAALGRLDEVMEEAVPAEEQYYFDDEREF